MKKSFKKLMAVVLSILLMASSIGVFASEESTAPTIADYQAISDPVQITEPTYFPNELWSPYSNAASVADSWGVIYRVDFPDMTGKEFNNFIFRFATQTYSGNKFRIMGVPSSYDIPNMSPDVEPFVSMLANEGAYISNVGDILVDETNSPYYINYADLTDYANECISAGDTYMYLFVNCSSTCKIFSSSLTDSTYIGLKLYPYYYYDTNDAPIVEKDLELKSSTPSNGAADVLTDTEITLTYNSGIEFADATLNGEEVEAICDGTSVVKINAELEAGTQYTLIVNVTDADFRELQTTLNFETKKAVQGFDPENPTVEGYQTISEPVQITEATYFPNELWSPYSNAGSVADSWGVIYKVPFPDMTGKEFKNFIFRFGTQTYSGNKFRIMGVPASYDIPNMSPDVEPFVSMLANEGAYISNVGDILVDETNSPYYINYADLTSYANDCLASGNTYMYLLVNCSSTCKIFSSTLTDSTYRSLQLFPYYYYDTQQKNIELLVKETTPENGAKDAKADTPVEFIFSNTIDFASATVNGADAEAVWENNKVTVNADFKQYTNYTVEVDITDIYSQEMKTEISFTTAGAFVSPKQTDGESWHISSTDSATMVNRSSIDLRQNNFILHKIPVPVIDEGEILDSYKLSYVLYPAGYTTYVLKFEGEDWDPSSMKTTDEAVAAILSNYASYNITQNQTSEEIEAKHFLHTDDITAYVNECMLLGQEYMYLGVITPASTMQSFGYTVSDASYKQYATYGTYSTVYPEISAVDAKYEVNGAHLSEMSFRVLTDAQDFADNVILRDTNTKTEVKADFAYNEYSRVLSLASPLSLSEDAEYEVVIKAGIEDYYGNTNAEDIVCLSFETGKNYEIAGPKLVSAQALDYDSSEAVTTPDKTSSYRAISKITNNTNENLDVIIFVSKYDASGKKLLGVSAVKTTVPAGDENVDVLTNSLEQSGESGIIKVSLWNGKLKPISDTLVFEIK